MKPASIPSVTDYYDWLSPILVKELRQGLRSRVFLLLFCLLQFFLLVVLLSGIGSAGAGQSLDANRAFFWLLVAIPIGVITPLQAISAFSQERENQNLEAILLTRMRPRQIVFGKWWALFSIALLMGVSALPYAVTRYFLGSVDVLAEVTSLAFLLLSSAVFTMGGLVLSLMCGRVMRFLVMAAAVVGLFGFWSATLLSSRSGVAAIAMPTWIDAVALVVAALLMFLILLENGAARVGSAVENHATRQRLFLAGIAIYLFVCGANERLFTFSSGIMIILGLFFLVIMALMPVEPIVHSSSVYRPFVKKGMLGRLAGIFLYPGWPSGVAYCALMLPILAISLLTLSYNNSSFRITDWPAIVHGILAVIGVLFFPAAVYHLIKRKLRVPGEAVLLPLHTIQAVMSIVLFAFHNNAGSGLAGGAVRFLTGFLPTTQLLAISSGDWAEDYPETIFTLAVTDVVSLAILIVLASKAFRRQIRPLEALAVPSTHAVS